MVLKIPSLSGALQYGDEHTGVGSDNSISYSTQSAVPNAEENTAGNSTKIEALPTSPGHLEASCVKV